MIAGALEVQLLANVARLRQDMAEAKGIVGSAAREIDRFAGGMRTALGALGFGLSAAGIIAWGKSIIDAADELSKLSQRTGLAVRDLSELQYAGRLADVSTESLAKGVKGLSQKMLEANESTSKAGKIMAALGVDIRGGAMPAIEKIADAFAALPDGPTKTAVAVELFGKAGMDMIPMLNQGSAGLEKMREEARRLGIVMDEETAKAAEAFNDNMTTVRASSERLGITLLNEVAPALVRISEDMKRAAIDGGVLDGVLAGLRSTWSELFFGDPEKNRIRTIREEIALLLPMLEEAPGLAARVATLNKELDGLLSFQNLSGRNQAFGGAAAAGQATSSALEQSLRRAYETSTKTTKAMKELALADEHVVLWMRRLVEEAQRVNKEFDEQFEAVEKLRLAREGTIKNIREYAERLELETKWLGLSNAEREREIALLTLESAGFDRNAKDVLKLADRIRDAVQAQEDIRNQVSVWSELSNAAGSFFSDLVMNGKSAFDNLKRYLKDFLAQLLAIFAQRWVLQMVAGVVGGAAGNALAGQATSLGANTLTGAAANWLTGAAGSALIGSSAVGAGGAGAFAGATAAGSSSWSLTALGATGWGLIIVAAVAVVAAILGSRSGGPKPGGSFFGSYDASGAFIGSAAVPGSDNGRFYTPSTGDAAMMQLTNDFAAGMYAAISRYGGSATGFRAGFGFDQDPQGTADSRVTALLADISGRTLFSQTLTAGRDDADFQRATDLILRRTLLAALQASDFHDSVDAIFRSVDTATASLEQINEVMRLADIAVATLNLGITGLDFETLQRFQIYGEDIGDTFKRVADAWGWFQDNFTSDAVKLERAQEELAQGFAEMGLTAPEGIDAFRELVESLDVTDPRWQGLMALAPAFLLVMQAAGSATNATEGLASALERQAEIQRQIEESVRSSRESQLDRIIGARGGLTDFMNRTLLDTSLTTLDPFQRLGLARSEFESILMAAQGGDLGAAGRLGGAADTYLRIAREMFGSSPQYGDIFSAVTGGVKGVDDRLAIDQRQLEATLGMASTLIDVRDLLIDIRDNGARAAPIAKSAELGAR
ncbi:MAG: hypothetical protein IPM64_17460 [Phycisphaerales bacterium]|nr:hypothetical protein [Phycisphaerales bacterium]